MFLTFALAALAGALSLFRQRHLVLAGLSLGLCFLGLAGLFLLLANPVAAALQVMVYAGAIVVLVLMVVMLLEAHAEEPAKASHTVHRWISALLAAGLGVLAVRLVYRPVLYRVCRAIPCLPDTLAGWLQGWLLPQF